ncbi:type II toxin-antitoxin system VapC family toxin [Actinomyces oris]|uniref:type II toxin-antitoxin system VapC family toxin n=1 Tax=Actinomyces oris TaxID=544580 RepID=UPI002852B817|nr:type II toxin-antitoxin system VapC family toxin [Actinomyces oris]
MIYLDTSVALLSLLGQPGADEAARLIMDAYATEGLVSSCLLKVEMARAAHRDYFDVRVVDEFIAGMELVEIGPDVIERASALTGELKSLDAIHLATATLLDDPRHPVTVLTHDVRLADAARSQGLGSIDPLGS